MKKLIALPVLAFCLAGFISVDFAAGDDLEPAPFRGDPNSVLAKFDLQGQANLDSFSEGANPTFPLFPLPATITQDPTGAPFYQVELPNYIDDLPLKLMRIQYSWFGQTGDAQTVTINVSPNVPGGSIALVDSGPITPVPGVPNAFHRYDDFEIRPNPDFESIQVEFFNSDPRWLIFDTISTVPEPSTLSLGLLLVAGLTTQRWRYAC
ncbi:MAG: hypothetical protein RH917_03285 [Lacipirellulaceae bacterium]